MRKLKQLKRLSAIAEGKEREKRQNWLSAQTEYEYCCQQQTNLDEYFQNYAVGHSQEKVPAMLFANRRNMLSQIRQAQEQQRVETERCRKNEQDKFLLWQSQYHEKKSYQKLTEKRKKYLLEQESKTEEKIANELISQLFTRKFQKYPKKD